MTSTLTPRQIAAAMAMSKRGITARAGREQWPFTEKDTLGGKVRHYERKDLPADVQAKLVLQEAAAGSAIGRGVAIATAIEAKIGKRTAEENLTDLVKLTGGKRQRAEAILSILSALDTFIGLAQLPLAEAITKFCAAYNDGDHHHLDPATTDIFPDITAATVTRWRRHLKNAGVKRLAGNYGNRKGEGKIDSQPELQKFCIALVTEFPHISGKQISDSIRARFKKKEIQQPSDRSVQRWLNAWKAENKQLLLAVANPDAWKNKHMTAFGSASEGIERLNQRWEMDGTPADVMLKDGRHAIIGVIDVYSRRAMLHVVRTQKAVSVAALIRRAILEWGVPESIKSDNGADYTSKHIKRVVELLHLQQLFSQPFSGWEKPHIERLFRTFSHDLVELLPNYIGHNVAEREALRARQSFADRLFKKNETVELNMTAAELQDFCNRWTDDIHLHKGTEGLKNKTPFEMVAGYVGELRRIDNPRALDILLSETDGDGIRTVTKKGIRIGNGLHIAAELGIHVGDQVRALQDATDLGRIYVFTLDNTFICIAEDPMLTGVSRQEVAAVARERQKKHVQAAKAELKKASREHNVKEIAGEILDYKAERSRSLAQLPKPSISHVTPALTAAEVALGVMDARDRPIEQQPVDQGALVEVQELLRSEQVEKDTEEKRFRRWYALHLKQLAGEVPNDIDAAWLRSYTRTDEFLARKELLDEKGADWMNLEVKSA